jgi:Carboxypeptidase regulatory-like domain
MKTLAIAACALIALAGTAYAQQTVEQTIQIAPGGGAGPIQLPPGFGGARQFKTGAGRIRGRVVAADSGNPVRRATVSISSPDIATKAAMTDVDGRFEFRDLPASKFTLHASKAGYMAMQYGQTRPFETGKAIELAEKQAVDNINIVMPKGGVISGRIVDEYGDPMPDVNVTAMRQAWSNGRRRLMPSGNRGGQTNDLGQFRIYGLAPGEYFVSATTLTGFLSLPMPAIEFDGKVVNPAGGGVGASVPKSGYAPTYFPGTPNPGEAQKITLAAGQEATSIDFGLVAVRMATVSGFVVNSEGKPYEGASINMVAASRDSNSMLGTPLSARAARDGSFTLNGVPPGDYIVRVSSMTVITSTQSGDGTTMMFRSATMMGGSGEQEAGSTTLAVAGEDIAGVMITTVKGGTATGRVTFDGPKPASMNVRVNSAPVDGDTPLPASFGGATVKDDGTFELKGLSGQRMLRVSAPPGWIVRSVKLNGIDITDTGAEFKPGETTSGLEIELTSRSTSVTGTVTTNEGSILKDYTVVLFAEDSELWRLPMTRWVTGGRPDQDGRFKIQNLPAGRYYAAAVEYLPSGEWGDPELLDRLKSHAKRFSLDDGGTQTLDLKLITKY